MSEQMQRRIVAAMHMQYEEDRGPAQQHERVVVLASDAEAAIAAAEQRGYERGLADKTAWAADPLGYEQGYADGQCDMLARCRAAIVNMEGELHSHYRMTCEPPSPVDWSQHRSCDPIDDILAALPKLGDNE
jgi:hypothetical protein